MSSSLRRGTGEHRALIVVDVQNDFCEGGSLAVTGGAEVARRITEHVLGHANEYDTIVATADWHDDPGGHFAEHPDFVDSWPPHCRIGTDGALFHPATKPAFQHVEAIFRKGNHAAAYSAFGDDEAQVDPGDPGRFGAHVECRLDGQSVGGQVVPGKEAAGVEGHA